MEWHEAIDQIKGHTVKITTPEGQGTGFLIALNRNLKCVATAAHVVERAHYWQHPIRITHAVTSKEVFLRNSDRVINVDSKQDTASIAFVSEDEGFPADAFPFTEQDRYYKVGVDIGWVGFPSIRPDSLCFFNGRISCWVEDEKFYLVDGVSINGVSGGPAFFIDSSTNGVRHIGLVSGYIPNLATGISMPGLCVIRDIHRARSWAKEFKTLAEAREKSKTQTPTSPPPPPVPPTPPSQPPPKSDTSY
ncbi:MAG: trypsin-like peptidase domain-containing protein [Candidatus Dadabacteria bacterium]|nr:trypsin-like peptidase domain-containing protein [Candidatus Dadabacteria bacterium]